MSKQRKILLIALSVALVAVIAITMLLILNPFKEPIHVHAYSEWKTVRAASCSEAGEKQRSCTECGETWAEALPKTDHAYTFLEEWEENGKYYIASKCEVCAGLSEKREGVLFDENELLSLWDCPADFSFVVCSSQGEDYVRNNVVVVDSYFKNIDFNKYPEAPEKIKVEAVGENKYRILSETAYKSHTTYAVLLSGDVTFSDFDARVLEFRIGGEEKNVVEYNDGLVFLSKLKESNPEAFPYTISFDDTTSKHTLRLATKNALDASLVGKTICVGECESIEDIQSGKTEDIVFGKVESIQNQGDTTVAILSAPDLNDVYKALDISSGIATSVTDVAMTSEVEYQLLSQLVKSDGFAEALTASNIALSNYAKDNGAELLEDLSDIKDLIKKFDVKLDKKAEKKNFEGKEVLCINADFLITFSHDVAIKKESIKGCMDFEIELSFQTEIILWYASANYVYDEGSSKWWWDDVAYLKFDLLVTQVNQTGVNFNLSLKLDEKTPELDYIWTGSGKIHKYNCITCSAIRKNIVKESASVKTLEEIQKIPQYTDYECRVCKPFTVDAGKFVLNLDTKTLHCGDCNHAKNLKKTVVSVYDTYPYGMPHDTCKVCRPQDRQGDFDEYVKNSLSDTGWDVVFNRMKSALNKTLPEGGAPSPINNAPILKIDFAYIFRVPIYYELNVDFDLKASLGLSFRKTTANIYHVFSYLDENKKFVLDATYETRQSKDQNGTPDLNIQGEAELRLGVQTEVRLSFVGMEKHIYVGVFAEAGIYGKLNGILHLDKGYENYYAAHVEAGVYIDARLTYAVEGLLAPGGKDIYKNDFPIFESGDRLVYYAFEAYKPKIKISNTKPLILDDALLKASYFDLSAMESKTGKLSWSGNDQYGISVRFEDEKGNAITDLIEFSNGQIIFVGNLSKAPDLVMYVSVFDKNVAKNLSEYLFDFNRDGEAFYMPELEIAISCSAQNNPDDDDNTDDDNMDDDNTDDDNTDDDDTSDNTQSDQETETASVGLSFVSNGDGTCCVSSIGMCEDTDVVIPAKSPDGDVVTAIGDYAFRECRNLISITIPTSVECIGYGAFSGCVSLTSITIPTCVTSIGTGAFSACVNLIEADNGVYYADKWVIDCDKSVTSVILRTNTVGIADGAFSYCSNLASITIPEGVMSIGDSAFFYCSSLISISIPDNVAMIGAGAFSNCRSLTSITIPEGVMSIGTHTFFHCSSLISISIPEGVTTIGASAFAYCNKLNSITIPESVTSIGIHAFSGCGGLTSMIFENTDGWVVNDSRIFASDLADPTTAAEYLRQTYCDFYWNRTITE